MKRRITSSYYNYCYSLKQEYISNLIKKYLKGIKKANLLVSDDFYEFLQLGRIELLYTMINYDKEKSSFNTYLYIRILGALRHLKILDKQKNNDIDFINNIPNKKQENNYGSMLIEDILSCLNDEEKQIIQSCCIDGLTLRKASNIIGKSYCAIHHTKKRAFDKIRLKFGEKINENI